MHAQGLKLGAPPATLRRYFPLKLPVAELEARDAPLNFDLDRRARDTDSLAKRRYAPGAKTHLRRSLLAGAQQKKRLGPSQA